jgi:pimeloyl-ACP methyl ester carboxylesterase
VNVQSHIVKSTDGVPIHYNVQGEGTTALVFVHGWCGNRHIWDHQMDHFVPHYTVASLDLAGHGTSGRNRARWTIPAFGEDVAAVVRKLGSERIVLIGHSIGGRVIVEAAHRLPHTVIGLVGVETWHDLEHAQTPAQVAEFLAPFRNDFVEAGRALAPTVFAPTTDPALIEDAIRDMQTFPPDIAIAVWEEYAVYERTVQERLQQVRVPKMAINSTYPLTTNAEAMQRCGIEVVFMAGVGHNVMIEDPQSFNRLLGEAVKKIVHLDMPQ